MPDAPFDLRLAWCFSVVASVGNFGRAAAELHTTQPSLSRQIQRLEQQLGVELFDRTPNGSHLTAAGEAFRPLVDELLAAAERAASVARAAAAPTRLTVGYTPGVVVTAAVREMRHRHPGAEIVTRHLDPGAPGAALLGHRVDVAVARLPFPTDGLDVAELYSEPRVVVVSREHRLAGKESITLDDIADEPMPQLRTGDPTLSAFWRIDPRPDGSSPPDGPVVESAEDKFEAVAAGEAVLITVEAHTHTLRPDLTSIPLDGVEPSRVVVASRSGDRSLLVTAFRNCVAGWHGPEQ